MDKIFWHKKWEKDDIKFHEGEANRLFVQNFQKFFLLNTGRIFLPLCGKSFDIHWLLSRGYRIVGIELSKIAIKQLFVDLGITPKIENIDQMIHYSAHNIDIFEGDIFDLSTQILGSVDFIYDRAALVALPKALRYKYASHIAQITNQTPQLLICYEYDQLLMNGPPFSVNFEEIHELYKNFYTLKLIKSINVPHGLKGIEAKEKIWHLDRLS